MTPPLGPMDPLVFRALPSDACQVLRHFWDQEHLAGRAVRVVAHAPFGAPLTEDMRNAVTETLFPMIQRHFGLRATYVEAMAVVRYQEGDRFDEHIDAVDLVPYGADRTVSFSLLLSEPDADFEGGTLNVNGQPVALRCGDLCAFTARTPHSVDAVTRGQRYVLVAFGSLMPPEDDE